MPPTPSIVLCPARLRVFGKFMILDGHATLDPVFYFDAKDKAQQILRGWRLGT
jgi:hypothetical protein